MSEKRFSGFSNNFGAIRILLAIAVVFSDSFLLGDGVTNADPMKRFNHGEAITGHVAVDLFFIMSGYLITLSLMRSSLPRYFWHRIRRVYPGFILATVFSFLVVLPLSGGSITPPVRLRATGDFVYHTLRLGSPTYFGAFPANPFPGDVNLSLWSNPYGFSCYILAAVLSAIGWAAVAAARTDLDEPGGNGDYVWRMGSAGPLLSRTALGTGASDVSQ